MIFKIERNLPVFLTVIFLSAFTFSGCSKKTVDNGKIKVIATIFPCYDWAREVIGNSEGVELELLIKNGTDLHSFQPSTADIIKITSSDVFIYVGGESDFWVEELLKNSLKKEQKIVNLMEILQKDVKEEEFIEGMTEGESEEAVVEGNDGDEVEYDEHVWLSLENAIKCSAAICQAISSVDLANDDIYEENAKNYARKLKELHLQYAEKNGKNEDFSGRTVIVADRFPFRYMTDELGMKYFAAFVGCSAETEASFETIAFLSGKIKALDVKAVFITETSDGKIARTVIENSKRACKVVALDSMQATTLEQAKNGKTYIETMRANFEALRTE